MPTEQYKNEEDFQLRGKTSSTTWSGYRIMVGKNRALMVDRDGVLSDLVYNKEEGQHR